MFRLLHQRIDDVDIRDAKNIRSDCLLIIAYSQSLIKILDRKINSKLGVTDYRDAANLIRIILTTIRLMDAESKEILKKEI